MLLIFDNLILLCNDTIIFLIYQVYQMLTFEVLRGFELCSFNRLKTLWCPPWFYLNNFTKWPSVYEIQYFNWFTIKSVDALSADPTKWSNTLKQFRRIVWVCLIILRDWRKMIKRIKGLLLQNSLIFFLKTVQNNELMNYEF